MDIEIEKKKLDEKMSKTLEFFLKELSGIRTGRANVNLLDSIKVDAYGSLSPLSQVSNVSVSDARTLTIQVWDAAVVPAVLKAISDSPLGIAPNQDGNLLRLNIPPLTEERRLDFIKLAKKEAEDTRIAVRHSRREGMDGVKKNQKDNSLSEDDVKRYEKMIQDLTDLYIAKIDKALEEKEKDMLEH